MEDDLQLKLQWLNYYLEEMKRRMLTKEEYRNLQYLLMRYEFLYHPKYPLCKTQISGDKIMFISDTHVGGPEEDRKLHYIAYNTAIRNDIQTVIHAGDMTEAGAFYQNKTRNTKIKEIRDAVAYMPYGITTKLLLGNHDFNAVKHLYRCVGLYFNFEPRLEILGMHKVLLDWDGVELRLNHFTSQLSSKDEINEPKSLLEIDGHHHVYKLEESFRTLCLPPLSKLAYGMYNLDLCKKNITAVPAFVIATKQGSSTITFEVYCVGLRDDKLYIPETIELNTESKQLRLFKH